MRRPYQRRGLKRDGAREKSRALSCLHVQKSCDPAPVAAARRVPSTLVALAHHGVCPVSEDFRFTMDRPCTSCTLAQVLRHGTRLVEAAVDGGEIGRASCREGG